MCVCKVAAQNAFHLYYSNDHVIKYIVYLLIICECCFCIFISNCLNNFIILLTYFFLNLYIYVLEQLTVK